MYCPHLHIIKVWKNEEVGELSWGIISGASVFKPSFVAVYIFFLRC